MDETFDDPARDASAGTGIWRPGARALAGHGRNTIRSTDAYGGVRPRKSMNRLRCMDA
ncbi:hypothetical protein [Methylobacterium marchantiae]|uniref:hypothetical protein n=1 Tax=Methylobacterium marchantiae TaxID=600331 RepID=UPI00366B04A8